MTVTADPGSAISAGAVVAERLRAALRPLLAAATTRNGPTLVSASLPVEAADPIALFAAARGPGADPVLWSQPSQGTAAVAIGSAWASRTEGTERFALTSRAWTALAADAIVSADGASRGIGPTLIGGFGFADAPSRTSLWQGFEAASLVVPDLLWTLTPAGCWLTASVLAEPGWDADRAVDRIDRLWRGVAGAAANMAGGPTEASVLRLSEHRQDTSAWRDSVARLAGAVGRGRIDKAVLARQVELLASTPIDVPGVLRRLRGTAPESTLFAVTRGERTFLGATPERLIRLRGRDFQSVAMAGSARRATDPASDEMLAAELLASDKEREEHAVVVTMLRETLAPLAGRLEMAPSPSVVRLRHLQHLVTPIEGRLRESADVLSLVERLHPTPAVGGTPRELALQLIADEELHERGWYAGPLGWVDRHGDGEFVVALRSGVIEGRAATLFAGCGIVADSDPDREWDESTTKLLALGSALGRVEP